VDDRALPVLRDVLEEARRLGFLGPGSVDGHLSHAEGFAAAVDGDVGEEAPNRFLDLGAGGGVPGLVLALRWRASRGELLDASTRRTAFLDAAVVRLGLADRVRVLQARAEVAAHEPGLRSAFDLVTARGFGPPAVTAECAVGFLRPGARLAVSEPPESRGDRWPADGLARLGLGPAEVRHIGAATVAVMRLGESPDPRWPRRTGIPTKRPLWT
jgi:16S rRNA (guanine527-N7)-methyltransferase